MKKMSRSLLASAVVSLVTAWAGSRRRHPTWCTCHLTPTAASGAMPTRGAGQPSGGGRHDEAVQQQTQAVTASLRAHDHEPPMLAAGARVALGDMQLRAGQPAQADGALKTAR